MDVKRIETMMNSWKGLYDEMRYAANNKQASKIREYLSGADMALALYGYGYDEEGGEVLKITRARSTRDIVKMFEDNAEQAVKVSNNDYWRRDWCEGFLRTLEVGGVNVYRSRIAVRNGSMHNALYWERI